MGRTKQYEREELLDRAVELFRQQGFNGTSTAELVEELLCAGLHLGRRPGARAA